MQGNRRARCIPPTSPYPCLPLKPVSAALICNNDSQKRIVSKSASAVMAQVSVQQHFRGNEGISSPCRARIVMEAVPTDHRIGASKQFSKLAAPFNIED